MRLELQSEYNTTSTNKIRETQIFWFYTIQFYFSSLYRSHHITDTQVLIVTDPHKILPCKAYKKHISAETMITHSVNSTPFHKIRLLQVCWNCKFKYVFNILFMCHLTGTHFLGTHSFGDVCLFCVKRKLVLLHVNMILSYHR